MINKINNFLKNNEFSPSKERGQNFLIDTNIINKIVQTVNDTNPSKVLEIGPGLGAISEQLIKQHKTNYHAIELDKKLFNYLNNDLLKDQIIHNDALKIEWDVIFDELGNNPTMVGNLPYNISSKLIKKFILSSYRTAIIMVQKEMALRLLAKINSKDYSSFSVLCQYHLDVKKVIEINENSFIPKPKIKSTLLLLEKKDIDFNEGYEKFLKLIFLQRRKTILNNLKNNYNPELIRQSLNRLELKESSRAQELSKEQLFRLYELLS
ncbi:16S rRNA (adenine(1518)-N(6)/adenine(1519)-N(6))-dimethyltransferase RsmA [Mycoplasma bradburyae]|uniref:16S rRNA (adenine(1518)-N(6)/adenine(1519)-N(6))- dimethyltransferase RsmA n=1 Tax=Mycoplasma bradburyae TaxID=2963128 RepID=UPI002341AB27|nr:16S rRNA (adenine(1518)-N(6)/adenine(1519)-N(6))-dimethyltransferase RsmA [Mycoplasma bradburyae]MDC4182538.1 16S rRNA (adenine(1518)-N(6)/adenine(1519)-N(6))-dimethyltransferase RsmA [Mycoplasma bradburyae]